MSQIIGSGAGNFNNTAVVDSSEGEMQGRLFVNISGTAQMYSNGYPYHIDESSYDFPTIEHEHHKIHEGEHFFICGFEVLNSGLSAEFAVVTPDSNNWSHMTFIVNGTSQTEMYVYEGAAGSGVLQTPINNNRNAGISSSLEIFKNGSISVQGDLIFAQSAGLAGATPAKADNIGILSRQDEFILKSGTTYLFDIKSADDNNVVSYCGNWYEHTDKTQQF